MGDVIGSNLDDLKDLAKKCHRAGGTPSVRTKFIRPYEDKVIFVCYGPEERDVPGGTVKDLPEHIVNELQEAESKTEKLMELADIPVE